MKNKNIKNYAIIDRNYVNFVIYSILCNNLVITHINVDQGLDSVKYVVKILGLDHQKTMKFNVLIL